MTSAFKQEGSPVTITVSSSASAATKLTDTPDVVRIANLGTATVWVKFGDSTVSALTTTGMAIGAGVHEVQRFPTKGPAYVSVIAAGSTGDIQFTPGSGL